jgi:hypothetical protein
MLLIEPEHLPRSQFYLTSVRDKQGDSQSLRQQAARV